MILVVMMMVVVTTMTMMMVVLMMVVLRMKVMVMMTNKTWIQIYPFPPELYVSSGVFLVSAGLQEADTLVLIIKENRNPQYS